MGKSKFQQYDDTPEQEPKQQSCQAHGCPLAGTKTLSPGDAKWWCRYHYGQDTANFGEVTSRIGRSMAMIGHLQRVKRAHSAHHANPPSWMTHYTGNEAFSKREDENLGQYAMRLEIALRHFILDGLTRSGMETAKQTIVESQAEALADKFSTHPGSSHD